MPTTSLQAHFQNTHLIEYQILKPWLKQVNYQLKNGPLTSTTSQRLYAELIHRTQTQFQKYQILIPETKRHPYQNKLDQAIQIYFIIAPNLEQNPSLPELMITWPHPVTIDRFYQMESTAIIDYFQNLDILTTYLCDAIAQEP